MKEKMMNQFSSIQTFCSSEDTIKKLQRTTQTRSKNSQFRSMAKGLCPGCVKNQNSYYNDPI